MKHEDEKQEMVKEKQLQVLTIRVKKNAA